MTTTCARRNGEPLLLPPHGNDGASVAHLFVTTAHTHWCFKAPTHSCVGVLHCALFIVITLKFTTQKQTRENPLFMDYSICFSTHSSSTSFSMFSIFQRVFRAAPLRLDACAYKTTFLLAFSICIRYVGYMNIHYLHVCVVYVIW